MSSARNHSFLVALFVLASGARAANDEPAIPREYFGLHIHRADQGTVWPNVPFGSWRLWDAYVTWADLETAPGKWDFSRLDRYVALAKLTNVDILLPLANTPTWAAARQNEKSGYKPGNASEPERTEDWRRYVQTVGERYRGRIFNYEIWNEPNIKHHYSGSVVKLVELACAAHKVLKAIDARNMIISPSATAGAKDHVSYLDTFLASGGRECVDIIGHHFYVPNMPPESMVPLIRQVKSVMKKNRVENLPLWNTETGWWIENGDGTPDHPLVAKGGWKKLGREKEAGDYVVQAFLLARAEGVDRFYWYSWDNQYGLGLIEPMSGEEKPIVGSWRNIVGRLINAKSLKCLKRAKEWQCGFVSANGVAEVVSWSSE